MPIYPYCMECRKVTGGCVAHNALTSTVADPTTSERRPVEEIAREIDKKLSTHSWWQPERRQEYLANALRAERTTV